MRDRAVDGGRLVEIVRGPVEAASMGVRLARALGVRAGAEVTLDARRGGGHELVVALPALG